ncbi:MAG: PAS domain S-box protein [Proteobacteria bacterium]|nr:PAS domain S-box protein [Pseudomonadota bacterium]
MSDTGLDRTEEHVGVVDDQQLHRLLVEAVADYAIYMLDPSGRVASWNPGAQEIKGYAPAEIIGRHYSQFFTEEDRAAGVPERALETARTVGRYQTEGWRLRKDGSRFWAMAVLDAVRDDSGRLIGFAKITRDMTERRAAEEALRESERQFRLLVAGVVDYALYMLSPTGEVTSWNTGAERIKGYAADEVMGRHFSMFYTPEDLADGRPTLALETARATGRFEAEGWRVRKDGSRFWANVIIDAIRGEDAQLVGFAKITRDITERKEAEERLAEAREQLFQAQKMEAIGQLTGGVAHDFNNLLTVIVSGVDLALRKIEDPKRAAQLLQTVSEAAHRGASLTRQLLAFSRRQSLTPEPVAIDAMMPAFRDLLDRSIGAGVDMRFDIEPGLAVEADLRQLELALLNICLNARDAMGQGGRLTLKAERRAVKDGPDEISGDFVAISISDTGTGIPAELINRVFEPFFTTKEVGRGTGLGLSQAYGFARQSGGTLTIESKEGEGTTVTFLLPETHVAAASIGGRAAEPRQDLAGHRLLVVEDDPRVAEVTCALLREAGAEVTHAADAHAALRALAGGKFDLVFSDVVMPGGRNGFDLAREINQSWPHLPVLLTTGYGGPNAGAGSEFRILSKPYAPEDLRRAVAESLHVD